jgi:hypothetical protein
LLPYLPDPEGCVGGECARAESEGERDEKEVPNPLLPAETGPRRRTGRGEVARPRAYRPWHFLYFIPDPHQQWSLRPIRTPDGE